MVKNDAFAREVEDKFTSAFVSTEQNHLRSRAGWSAKAVKKNWNSSPPNLASRRSDNESHA
jgi:hypothetical protein